MTQPISVVTGGGGPQLGWGICLALAEHGNHVVVADADPEAASRATSLLREMGFSATPSTLDVTDLSSVQEAIKQIETRLGRIDSLVNSAGIGLDKPIQLVTSLDFDRLMHVNVRGAMWCASAVSRVMAAQGGGSIVNIGTVHALGTATGYGLYSASKSALVSLSRALAVELGDDRIRCNVVHPGALRREQDLDPESGDPEVRERHAAFARVRQVIHSPIRPVDVGNAVAFLASDAARMITGTELTVDAGTSALLHDLRPATKHQPR